MPDSETFDAFYARTVARITSQMHEQADNDALADHAIREAYAKAYQQWYEVSGYSDSEEWVLSAAREAYERRRTEAGFDRYSAAAQAADSGTWPGIYRPRADAASHAAADLGQPFDPDATVARPARPKRSAGWLGGKQAAGAAAGEAPDYPAARAPGGGHPARGHHASGGAGAGAPARGTGLSQPVSRKTLLIAGSAIAVLVIASVAYFATGGHTNSPSAGKGNTTPAVSKPKAQMLLAGKTGTLLTVPWLLVQAGWALAEFSTAHPNSAGQASGAGKYTTYLVDPKGGKYTITTSSGSAEPQLLAWSGNTKTALFDTAGSPGSYQLLDVRTGQRTPLQLPAGVVALGFSRPDGTAILAVSEGRAKFHLQRYTLTGQFQASIATLPRKSGETLGPNGCATACAISSPDGISDVWGVLGDGMQMLSNAGGKATRPHLQGSGHPSLCMPVTWWNDTTVLANCAVTSGLAGSSRLWLVPKAGGSPTPLTDVAGSASGAGVVNGAWQAGGGVYVTQTSFHQCPGAPSGPGGLDILPVNQGANAAMVVPGTHNFSTVVATSGTQLLVLTQTSCPGSSSLLWFNPSTHGSKDAILAPANQVGVIAAVPFGNGPTAVTAGDN